jgi:BlaI family penicillinase repressor
MKIPKMNKVGRCGKSARQISEAEWKIMHALWKSGRLSSNEVVAEVVPDTGWSPNTVRTLLNRLTDKGVLRADKERGKEKDYPLCFYTPLCTREECEASHAQTFLEKVFEGDASRLLAHFVRESTLTPKQIVELRKKLEEM